MKKVSIVVPCYNVAMYIDRCVESLVNQTIGMENLEIILVNDASCDVGRTWGRIMALKQEYPDAVTVVSLEENLRQGGARNAGISYAGGEYLMFCDADDWLALDAVECLYRRAKEYDADVVEYRMENIYEDTDIDFLSTEEGKESFLLVLDTEEAKKDFYLKGAEEKSFGCMTKFYRMSLMKDNNIRFAEHLICEGVSYALPVRFYEKRHYRLDKLLYYYYMSPYSRLRSIWDVHKLDRLQVWKILVEDLQKRGFLQKYYDEIEYLFYLCGYAATVKELVQWGDTITVEEMKTVVETAAALFPKIRSNTYLQTENEALCLLLKTVLDMELTEESVQTINEILRKYV